MRRFFRIVAPVAAAAMMVLAGSSTAFAAAAPTAISLDDHWCFDDAGTLYCFDIDGTMRFNDNTAGQSVSIHRTVRTTVYEDGQVVGTSKSVAMERETVRPDGTVIVKTGIHTRAVNGDDSCNYSLVLRLVDDEAVVDHEVITCL
jgi:outer membrane protein assembly factor BamB